MTAFLLDTSALVDFSKRREPAYSQILAWVDGNDTLAVCAISVAEFYSGLSPSESGDWQEFITSLDYWPISPDAAMLAGQDRYRFARQGIAITVADSLLAALARARNAVLVTGHVKDFPMQDVAIFQLDGKMS